jgi:hypothetical protein
MLANSLRDRCKFFQMAKPVAAVGFASRIAAANHVRKGNCNEGETDRQINQIGNSSNALRRSSKTVPESNRLVSKE